MWIDDPEAAPFDIQGASILDLGPVAQQRIVALWPSRGKISHPNVHQVHSLLCSSEELGLHDHLTPRRTRPRSTTSVFVSTLLSIKQAKRCFTFLELCLL